MAMAGDEELVVGTGVGWAAAGVGVAVAVGLEVAGFAAARRR